MSWIGKRIQHYKWGQGAVRAQRHGDYELFIKFDNGVLTWLKKSECNLISEEMDQKLTIRPKPPIIEEPELEEDDEALIKRQAIEAFKLGIVPPFVKDFIFGRDREITYVKKWLDQEELNYLLMLGDYGTGKSHMLKYIENIALEMNYAVSYCNLDPEESPIYKPKMVYRKIVSEFAYDGGKKNFRDFIQEISNENKNITTENEFLKLIMNYPKDDEIFWRWLEADDVIKTIWGFPTLYPYGTAANIFCNLLSIFGYYAKDTLGLPGVLLLFDEAESLHFPSFYQYQYQKGVNFFKGLLLTASNNSNLLNERISVSTPRTGHKTDLIYCGNNQIKYLFKNPSGLKVLFALTDSSELRDFCVNIGYDKYTPLKPLNENERQEVVDSIQRLYVSAFPYEKFDDWELNYISQRALKIGKENIRSLVKTTIEAMDLKRHYPSEKLGVLLK